MKKLQFLFLSLTVSLIIVACNGGSATGGSLSTLPYGNYGGTISPSLQTGQAGSSESITLMYTASGATIIDSIQNSTVLVQSGIFTSPLAQNLGNPCFTGTMGASSAYPNANIYFYGCSVVNNGTSITFTAQSFQITSNQGNKPVILTGNSFSVSSY